MPLALGSKTYMLFLTYDMKAFFHIINFLYILFSESEH
jgi:hypothetical protein